MIRSRDTLTLALTKLRTRKLRLFITILVSGLLFTGLAAASMVARGAFGSIQDFSGEGFGNRYLISGVSQADAFGAVFNNAEVQTRAIAIYKDTVNKKKVEAKRLGITYDPLTDPPPVEEIAGGGGGAKEKFLNAEHPAGKQALAEYQAANPIPGLPEFQTASSKYGATAFYKSRIRPYVSDGSSLQVLKDGKETYSAQDQFSNGPPTGIDSFLNSWTAMSRQLLETFALPGQNLDKAEDGSVPMIIPLDAAEQLLGLPALPSSAKPAEKLARIKEIRAAAGTLRFEICYRNNTSASLVSTAVGTQQEIDQNKNNKDYRRPELIYGLPTQPCGSSPITRDVRSAETKKLAVKQEEFDRIFGKAAPEQRTFKFRVVGVVPGFDFQAATNVTDIISSLLVSSLGTGWFMPLEALDSDAALAAVFNGPVGTFSAPDSYYAEFANPDQARAFESNASCTPDYSQFNSPESQQAFFEACEAEGKPFTLFAYGSNSLGLDSAKRGFTKFFSLAALVVAVIAAVIMMGTVGRMIADSRRETAVFRAIGAKKFDIAQIYVLYTIMLSLLVCAFAVLAGVLLASYAHNRFSEGLTVQALVAYNAVDLSRVFRLYSFYPQDMLYLLGLTLAAGLLSSVIPLLRNLRRNPIRDMRDDT